jgi:hypothetical protein
MIALRRTGRMVPFLDVNIGQPFFAHGAFWTRYDREAASKMAGSQTHGSCCTFTIDEADRLVESVEIIATPDGENIETLAVALYSDELNKRELPGPFHDLAIPNQKDVAAIAAITSALQRV